MVPLNKVIGLLFCFIALVTISTPNVSAQFSENVTINTNGTIEPATAPIQRTGETYVLTGNVGSITIERSNIVLDGNGNMLPGIVTSYDEIIKNNITTLNSGGIYLTKVENVTVKNLNIKDSKTGIYLDQATNCVIENNTITGTHALIPQLEVTAGIFVWGGNHSTITGNKLSGNYNGIHICYDSQNTITGNTIVNSSSVGLLFWNAPGNLVYCNNFLDNAVQVSANAPSINSWDNGEKGNYWSNYTGSDVNGDGLGDTPYLVDGNQQDSYPLMTPFDVHSTTQPTNQPPVIEFSPMVLVIVALGVTVLVVVSSSVIVYYKRRRRHPNAS